MNDFYSGYGFQTEPFRLTPDPGFRFAHAAYGQAAEALQRALAEHKGIAMLTGKPGTGKTTLVGDLLNRMASPRMKSAVLTSTQLGTDDLLRMIAQAFDLHSRSSDSAAIRAVIDQFLQRQAQAGQTTLLVVDEAQNLSVDALDTLCLLNGGGDGDQPGLDVLLVGQEQLLEKLRLPELKALSQRIVEAAHLGTLDTDDTRAYIEHRLTHAGWQGRPRLTADAYQLIQLLSRGLPRYINKLCARLLVHGGIDARAELNAQDVLTVGREMRDELLVPHFADSDLDSVFTELAVDEPERAEDSSQPAADEAAPAMSSSPGATGRTTTSIDRAYRPPETAAAGNGAEKREAAEGDSRQGAAVHATDGGGAPPRRARNTSERALVAGILVLMVAVGYGIWRHHPRLWKALESSSETHAVTHRQTTLPAAKADGAVQRSGAPPSPSAATPATGATGSPEPAAAAASSPAKPGANPSGGAQQAAAPSPPASGPAVATAPSQPEAVATPPTDKAAAAPHPPASSASASQPQGAASGAAEMPDNPPAAPGQSKVSSGTEVPAQGTTTHPDEESSRLTLSELGAKAQAAFDDYRLTIPAAGSAYYYYQLMLARAPDDPRAKQGIERIVERYLWLAQRAVSRQDYDRARNYIHRGLGVSPDNPEFLKLQSRLNAQRSAARASGAQGTGGTPPGAPPATGPGVPIPVTPARPVSP
ncbi:MAG: AAA family ATPase [Gammaproteobacteria bacterium]